MNVNGMTRKSGRITFSGPTPSYGAASTAADGAGQHVTITNLAGKAYAKDPVSLHVNIRDISCEVLNKLFKFIFTASWAGRPAVRLRIKVGMGFSPYPP